jgi:hypothetical protein
VALLLGLALQSAPQSLGQSPGSILPGSLVAIESIRLDGTNIVVTVDVSADVKSVFLESRLRIGSGSWDPRAIQRMTDFTTPVKAVTFRIPRTESMELIRARGETTETLPATFFQGTNSIQFAVSGVGNSLAAAPPMATAFDDRAKVAAPAENASGSAARSVVESDIWKLHGDTLYFFNQYRGLQVIDIARPDKPVVRGAFDLLAAGEQMYLLGSSQVVLLARDNCNWGPTAESELMLLEVKDGQPIPVAELAIAGQIRESRLVGTALYVVSERYQPMLLPAKPGDRPQQAWEWGSQVTSFDLSDFVKPVVKSKEWVSSGMYQNVNAIMATDQYLFVAAPTPGQNSWNGNSSIHVFDISAPDGTMQKLSSIPATGKVKDKFKMNLDGTTFSAVTETWNLTRNNPSTQVETYSLADPKSPKQLAVLKIIEREQLHATRFDGDLLYAVTFFRIDPLWIIDLSDPANPKKVSELEIPGYSTYIQPLNGRLVTIGLDNTAGWRTAVQLFDVENPAKPSLLSKVILGEQYSSSEANYDEKAFGVLPEDKLLLVPYSTYGAEGYFQGVHLIDLERDTLRKRGAIEHELQPRRATVHRNRILSVSGQELLSVDATDRDRPRVVSTTELSWAADRIYLEGQHLIEVSSQWNSRVSLRIVRADDPSKVLKQVTLSNMPFLGAVARDQRLYVTQGKSAEYVWEKDPAANSSRLAGTNEATLTLSIYDLSKLPEVPLLGQTKKAFGNRYWSSLTALWPKPGVLVWNASSHGGPWRILAVDTAVGAPGIAAPVDSRVAFAPWWGSSEGVFLAYDVANAAQPTFLSEVKVNGTNYWWSFSKAFAVDGLVYLSHQASEYLPYLRPPHWIDGTKPAIEPSPGVWAQRYFLDVINYADPKEPSVRKPVALPGSLIGVARKGQLLYTQGYRYTDVKKWTDMREYLDAVAYDGVETHGVDLIQLPQTWPRAVLANDAHLFISRTPEARAASVPGTETKVVDATAPTPASGATTGTLEVWTVADNAKFVRLSSTALSTAATDLEKFGNLLATQVNNKIQVYDATNPSDLKLRATGAPLGCIGGSLEYATGSLDRGLWIPLGPYGVTRILANQ